MVSFLAMRDAKINPRQHRLLYFHESRPSHPALLKSNIAALDDV
jgi:hypothetical protein